MSDEILIKIIKSLIDSASNQKVDLERVVRRASGTYKISMPQKSELLKVYHNLVENKEIETNKKVESFLRRRAIRTMSGVAVVSVLTKPFPCPGNCLYCPNEKGMPKSYIANEPAVMRAITHQFDPFNQVTARLKALRENGHDISKIEIIVMGGTWSYFDKKYQNWFIKRCFEALNGHEAETLAKAQKENETTKSRCVGLTLETRPDYIDEAEIKQMRKLGCTRVELGIQHINDKVLKLNRRGHGVKKSIEAIELLRRAGFKLNLHMMTSLYGSSPKMDLEMFNTLYTAPEWLPDMIKIYPCVVVEGTDLYKAWKQKKYKPYTKAQLLNLLIKIKKITPTYVRIARLIRDIPKTSIKAGNKITNLREMIQGIAKRDGWSCQCIRCREAGHQPADNETAELHVLKMPALGGTEYFISYNSPNKKVLYAFLRLRINDSKVKQFIPELRGAGLVRELHTYGEVAPVGEDGDVQHKGFGRKLMAEAERICQEEGVKKLAVIAGIGVREYYKMLGYELKGSYMLRPLKFLPTDSSKK
jgi:elongator complex protein 3